MERGDRAIKPFWCRHRFRELTGFANPPPGCDLPHELATAEEKRERLRELHRFAAEKGYKPGWVLHRYREQYGELPLRRVR